MAWLGLAIAPLCFAGFGAMALSMDRHHRDLTGAPCPAGLRRRLRRQSLVVFALAAATAILGRGIGIVAGVLGASLAAAAVVGVLSLWPQLLARICLAHGEAGRRPPDSGGGERARAAPRSDP
jgi:hypothetical protein